MATPPIEQDFILDADGRQVMTMIDLITLKMGKIKGEVGAIVDAAGKGGKDFDKSLDITVKRLQQAMGQMRTIIQSNNLAGPKVQDLNANRALAQQTRAATEYARELNTARNSAEALTAKIARLNQVTAARGKEGGFASVAGTDQLKRLEAAAAALKRLDAQYAALEARARRTKSVDLSPEINAVSEARGRLFTAASAPRRTNLTAELNGLTDAQAVLAERIAGARRQEAVALRSSFLAAKELATADASSLRTTAEIDRVRARSAEQIRNIRAQLRDASDGERSALLSSLEIEKARGRALAANAKQMEAMAKLEQGIGLKTTKALIPGQMRADASTYGANTVYAGAQFEKELALKRLSAAATDQERIASLRALDIANSRVSAAERLVAEERKELDLLNKETEAARRNVAANEKALAGRSARTDIENLGLYNAQAVAKQRVADVELRLMTATENEARALRETLGLEEKKLAVINGEVRAAEALAAAEARQAAATARQTAQQERRSLGGRVSTAAFNTALYGGVAAVGFGALNAAQEGLTFAVQFEDELAKLQAISASTGQQMQQLKGSIIDVGASSRFSIIDLTKISQTLAQAGVSAGEMKKVLTAVTTLATASGSTPDEAVNLVTSALGAFQLQASEAARVSDLMTTALNRTKLTVQQTGQAIQYVGATAFEQNISLETLLATVGAMAQAGIKSGSTIGTGLRQLFVDLQTPSKKLTEQLEKVGLTIADVNIAVNGEQAVLDKLADAGFGATQAYAGLETRAAAAYLVLKNNRGVIDDLKLGLAQSGAAAEANARAMDSLSAQWQRFKNLIGEGFVSLLEGPMDLVKDAVKDVSDLLEKRRQLSADGPIADQLVGKGNTESFFSTLNNYISNTSVALNDLTGIKIFDETEARSRMAAEGFSRVQSASRDLATQMNETTEKVDAQRNKVAEVEKEIARLVVQHSSLSGNNIRTQAETVSLTARFEGLSKFLTSTTDKYGDLINAMRLYNVEATKSLATELSGQLAVQQQEQNRSLSAVNTYRGQALANRGLMSNLTPQERSALRQPTSGNNGLVIGDAARRTNDPTLLKLSEELGKNAAATTQMRISNESLIDARARLTPAGQSLTDKTIRAEAGLTELGGLSGKARTDAANAAKVLAEEVVRETTGKLAKAKADAPGTSTLRDFQVRANAVLTGIAGVLAPTKDDIKEADRAEREAARGPKATQGDIDAVGRVLGLSLGSGTRSKAEQDALHARGVTSATGDTSSHSTGNPARDFPTGDVSQSQGEAMAAAARKYFADQGIPVYVKYENGKGKGQGTGKHVHVNLLPGARKSPKGANELEQSAFDAQADIDKAGTAIDQRAFTAALRDIKSGTSQTVIDDTAKLLARLGEDLERDARTELAKNGIANEKDPRFKERMAQVADQQRSLADQYSDAVTDGLIKNLEMQVKAATTVFELAIAPAQNALARSQAASTGLESYSLQNKVPDYVKTIAENRTKQLAEGLQRSRLANLPTQISSTESALSAGQARLSSLTPNDSSYGAAAAEVDKLRLAVTALRTEQDTLNASLNAGSAIPTTLAEGFSQAAEAYRSTHNLTATFKEDVLNNMTGALDEVNNGLTTMFTSIISGSQGALGAFASFAKGIMQYMVQLAAKAVATKVLNLLLSLGATAVGGSTPSAAAANGAGAVGGVAAFNGMLVQGFDRGGQVGNGSNTRDSVRARLAKGEWVVRKRAVDSVGNEFMANLNRHGAKALSGMSAMPALPAPARQETSVYVVAPQEKPQMGPNDAIVAIQNDILSGGETKKLIKYVIQGG